MTQQQTHHWTAFYSPLRVASSDNRRVGSNHDADADGRLLADNDLNYTYDVAGQMATAEADTVTTQSFDGNGQRVKTVETEGPSSTTTYYVGSSVLEGQVLTELNSSGAKQRTFVYSGSRVLAWQESPFGSPRVMWEHRDPTNASFRMSDSNASLSTGTDQEQAAELDPLGADSGTSNNYLIDPNPPDETTSLLPYPSFSDPRHPGTTYAVDGIRVPVDFFMFSLDIATHGKFGIAELLKQNTLNDNNYEHRWESDVEFPDHGEWVTTAIPLSPSLDWLMAFEPQNPIGPTQKPNSNCIINAVRGASGLARPFGNVGPTGTIGHDGIHVVAPAGSRVTTLAALTGTVLGIHNADEGKTHIVDVLLDKGGFVALYKDLVTVNVRPGQRLGVGSTIGTVGAYEGGGLHFALLNGGRAADQYYRSLTSTNQTNKIKVDMFTKPNGLNSPVNRPGVPVNNAGVNPHP
jgi:murein DD-endopeptidase MepM/ murein hydrolase activator NlpD